MFKDKCFPKMVHRTEIFKIRFGLDICTSVWVFSHPDFVKKKLQTYPTKNNHMLGLIKCHIDAT